MSGKFFLNEQDQEDYEQELAIKQWLEQKRYTSFEFTSINSKGNPRHIGDIGSISLDEKIGTEDGSGTYADIIAGSDGRDLEYGEIIGEDDDGMSTECCLEILMRSLGLNKEVLKWAMKTYQLRLNKTR